MKVQELLMSMPPEKTVIYFRGEIVYNKILPVKNGVLTQRILYNAVNSNLMTQPFYIRIGTNITEIDNNTFVTSNAIMGGGQMQFIYIPNTVKKIGKLAFDNQQAIESITIPNSVTFIGYGAFTNCKKLKTINLSNNLKVITQELFNGCIGLKNIIIPNSVTKINKIAFANCNNLESIIIPDSVIDIGEDCFRNCKELKTIKLSNNLKTISKLSFENCKSLENIFIPNSVLKIRNWAFSGCTNLKNVVINNRKIYISTGVFEMCINLKSLYLPSGANFNTLSLEKSSIQKLYTGDTNILNKFDESTPFFYISDGNLLRKENIIYINPTLFYFNDSKTIIERPIYDNILTSDIVISTYTKDNDSSLNRTLNKVEINDGVTEIGEGAFWLNQGNLNNWKQGKEGYPSLSEIIIPNSVTKIGKNAFRNLGALNSLNLPNSITNISENAFIYCQNLTSLNLPNNITNIGLYAFADCKNLTSLNIPDNLILPTGVKIESYFWSILYESGVKILYANANNQLGLRAGVLKKEFKNYKYKLNVQVIIKKELKIIHDGPIYLLQGQNETDLALNNFLTFTNEYNEQINNTDVQIKVDSTNVNFKKVGEYTITITAEYNGATSKRNRKVYISKKTKPGIILNESLNVVKKNQAFIPSINVSDPDNILQSSDYATTFTIVNTSKAGVYPCTLTAIDKFGNKSELVINVTVSDKKPIITFFGKDILRIKRNTPLNPEVIVTDPDNIVLQKQFQILFSFINTSKSGTYTMDIKATDPYGNFSTKSRTVIVMEDDNNVSLGAIGININPLKTTKKTELKPINTEIKTGGSFLIDYIPLINNDKKIYDIKKESLYEKKRKEFHVLSRKELIDDNFTQVNEEFETLIKTFYREREINMVSKNTANNAYKVYNPEYGKSTELVLGKKYPENFFSDNFSDIYKVSDVIKYIQYLFLKDINFSELEGDYLRNFVFTTLSFESQRIEYKSRMFSQDKDISNTSNFNIKNINEKEILFSPKTIPNDMPWLNNETYAEKYSNFIKDTNFCYGFSFDVSNYNTTISKLTNFLKNPNKNEKIFNIQEKREEGPKWKELKGISESDNFKYPRPVQVVLKENVRSLDFILLEYKSLEKLNNKNSIFNNFNSILQENTLLTKMTHRPLLSQLSSSTRTFGSGAISNVYKKFTNLQDSNVITPKRFIDNYKWGVQLSDEDNFIDGILSLFLRLKTPIIAITKSTIKIKNQFNNLYIYNSLIQSFLEARYLSNFMYLNTYKNGKIEKIKLADLIAEGDIYKDVKLDKEYPLNQFFNPKRNMGTTKYTAEFKTNLYRFATSDPNYKANLEKLGFKQIDPTMFKQTRQLAPAGGATSAGAAGLVAQQTLYQINNNNITTPEQNTQPSMVSQTKSKAGNSALGVEALKNSTTSTLNSAVGYQALLNNQSSSNNAAMGTKVGLSLKKGNKNLLLGNETDVLSKDSAINQIVIGTKAKGVANHTMVFGGTTTKSDTKYNSKITALDSLDPGVTNYTDLGSANYNFSSLFAPTLNNGTDFTLPTSYPNGDDYLLQVDDDGKLIWVKKPTLNGITIKSGGGYTVTSSSNTASISITDILKGDGRLFVDANTNNIEFTSTAAEMMSKLGLKNDGDYISNSFIAKKGSTMAVNSGQITASDSSNVTITKDDINSDGIQTNMSTVLTFTRKSSTNLEIKFDGHVD